MLTTRSRADRHEPGWVTERLIKDLDRDLPAWEFLALGGDVPQAQTARLDRAREEVGESYLLECVLGVPFFDFYAESRQGGLEQAIFDLLDRPAYFTPLQRRYQHRLVAMVDAVCARSTVESFFIGCSWSCVSCLGLRSSCCCALRQASHETPTHPNPPARDSAASPSCTASVRRSTTTCTCTPA